MINAGIFIRFNSVKYICHVKPDNLIKAKHLFVAMYYKENHVYNLIGMCGMKLTESSSWNLDFIHPLCVVDC